MLVAKALLPAVSRRPSGMLGPNEFHQSLGLDFVSPRFPHIVNSYLCPLSMRDVSPTDERRDDVAIGLIGKIEASGLSCAIGNLQLCVSRLLLWSQPIKQSHCLGQVDSFLELSRLAINGLVLFKFKEPSTSLMP